MVQILRNALKQLLNDIDSGNSHISESDEQEIISFIQKINTKEYSKVEAYQYLGISRATFDNYVSKGLIPEGKKKAGFNEKIWYKSDLDEFLKNKGNKYVDVYR